MQVSHADIVNTHAIMGGGQARAFGMSQSAEFFTVLSDTLYRDKKRAVVREVICNAWDAHITTGKEQTPIQITLSDDELKITDFGPGISDDRIAEIYCVYGNSTKVQDENQTGGFGLGSKAPFAYTDHFTVTSCHNGVKNVYAISRGGAETQGVPDLRVMVTTPTEDSGLTVSIPIANSDDANEFHNLIETVVRQGGMLAELNSEQIYSFDYSVAEKFGAAVVEVNRGEMTESGIYVLYGTVLYPISSTEPQIHDALREFKYIPMNQRIILLAPPNSVGVTPSRESLSFTDKTVNTIVGLLQKLDRKIRAAMPRAETILLQKVVDDLDDVYSLVSDRSLYDGIIQPRNLNDFDPITRLASWKYLSKGNSSEEPIGKFGMQLARRFPDHSSTLRRLERYQRDRKFTDRSFYLFRDVVSRIATKEVLRLGSRANCLNSIYAVMGPNGQELRVHRLRETLFEQEPERQFIIAQSQAEVKNYLRDQKKALEDKGIREKTLVFAASIPRSKPKLRAELASEAWALGFEVHEIKAALPKQPKKAPEVKKYHDFLSFDIRHAGSCFDADPTLESPEYYIQLTQRTINLKGCPWTRKVQREIKALAEDRGLSNIAVVRGDSQVEKLKKMGAKDIIEMLVNESVKKAKSKEFALAFMIDHEIVADPREHYYSNKEYHAKQIVENCPEAFFELSGLKPTNKARTLKTFSVWKMLKDYFRENSPKNRAGLYGRMTKAERETIPKIDELKDLLRHPKDFDHRYQNLNLISSYVSGAPPELVIKLIRTITVTTPVPEEEQQV